jgi:hypothetical protein
MLASKIRWKIAVYTDDAADFSGMIVPDTENHAEMGIELTGLPDRIERDTVTAACGEAVDARLVVRLCNPKRTDSSVSCRNETSTDAKILILSRIPTPPIVIKYISRGLSWKYTHQIVIDKCIVSEVQHPKSVERQIRVDTSVVINNNTGMDIEHAGVSLSESSTSRTGHRFMESSVQFMGTATSVVAHTNEMGGDRWRDSDIIDLHELVSVQNGGTIVIPVSSWVAHGRIISFFTIADGDDGDHHMRYPAATPTRVETDSELWIEHVQRPTEMAITVGRRHMVAAGSRVVVRGCNETQRYVVLGDVIQPTSYSGDEERVVVPLGPSGIFVERMSDRRDESGGVAITTYEIHNGGGVAVDVEIRVRTNIRNTSIPTITDSHGVAIAARSGASYLAYPITIPPRSHVAAVVQRRLNAAEHDVYQSRSTTYLHVPPVETETRMRPIQKNI